MRGPSSATIPGRNDPCWCGSLLKYKKCHLGRESQPRLQRHEAISAVRAMHRDSECLAASAPSGCAGKPIRSHTVQKASLRQIARKGHVYGIQEDIGGGSRPPVKVALIGVNNASTFSGFCSTHDAAIFRPLETADFEPTREQVLLLMLRAVSHELSAKRGVLNLMQELRQADRGLDLDAQRTVQEQVSDYADASRMALRRLERLKVAIEGRLATGGAVNYLVFDLKEPPTVMCSGTICPEVDLVGRVVQDLGDLRADLHMGAFVLCSSRGRSVAVYAWLDDDAASRQFARSLDGQTDANVPHALARIAFEHFENIFLAPDWWDGLAAPLRAALTDRWFRSMGIFDHERASDALVDDGVRAVSWSVTGRAREGL